MVASFAPGGIADVHDGGEAVAAGGFAQQADLVAALHHLEVEACDIAVGQGGVAFAAVVARVAPGDGADGDQIAAHGHFHLVIHLQADIALALAGGHIVAGHAAGLKARVG